MINQIALDRKDIKRGIIELLFTKSKVSPVDQWVGVDTMVSVLGVEKSELYECLLQLIDRGLIVSKDANKTMYKLTPSAIRTLDARLGTYCPNL